MIRIYTFLFLLWIPFFANATHWQIVPAESSLQFTATQNNSPVKGQFKKFSGDIQFDPNQLTTSQVKIIIDINSVSASYKELVDTLKTPDWFDIKLFPNAEFKATQFKKIDDKSYQADGNLTIRDKTIPTTLTFTLDEYTPTKAHVSGKTLLKRSDFGIGRGEWAKTDDVKDEVTVTFTLSAQSMR